MNFRTTSTIGDQMSHVKKYAPLLLLNIPRKYQYLLYSIPFFAIFADFVFNLLNHIYFLCIFDFFLFIVTIHTIISLRKKIMIPVVLRAKCKNVANKMQKIGFKKRHFKWLLNAK